MITVDGITYQIPYKVVNRKAEILFKDGAGRTEDGTLHAEAIGTYFNYDIQMGQSLNNVADYKALWLVLTDPNHEHTVIMPDEDGGRQFKAYFANMRDRVATWKENGTVYFRELTFSVIAISPQRVP